MAPTQTTRLEIYRWASNDDEFTRAQMDTSHQNLEDLVALFTADTFALRPVAGPSNARAFFLATDTNVLYYSNGTAWFSVNSFASPVGIVPGDINTDGENILAARADHKHSLPAFGLLGDIEATNTLASAGTDVLFARADHRHTIGEGSVVPGSLAVNSINAANLFTAQVVERDAIKDGAINKAKLDAQALIPSGTIMAYGGVTAPAGWLFCNGFSYDLNQYNDLYNAIGTRYGGSGLEFNVPDLRNRVPRGSAIPTDAVSSTSTDAVLIGANNLPQHTHSAGGITVANHDNHTHPLSDGRAANTYDANHAHGVPGFGAGGNLQDTYVYADNTYNQLFWGSSIPGHPNNEPKGTLKPNYFSGGGYEYPAGWTGGRLRNGAVNVAVPNHGTNYADNGTLHGHGLTGNTNPVGLSTHSVSGSTGNNTTTQTQLTVVPRHQTVNYIIKT
jgi:microcystin-dependent protein